MGSQLIGGQLGQSQLLRTLKLGLTTSHGVPSPNYDTDAYTATLFEGET